MSVRETRMMAKAVEQRWPISENARKAIISQLLKIIADGSSSKREITSAARALIAAEKQNQQDAVTDATDDQRNRFLEIAERLGVRGNTGRVLDRRTESDTANIDERIDRASQG